MADNGEMIRSGNGGSEAGVTTRQDFSGTEVVRAAETSQAALMAQYKAMVESRFVVAMRMPRNWETVRVAMNRMCENPDFAAEALYVKPIGFTPDGWNQMTKRQRLQEAPKNWPQGFSIRFIEAALFEMGNVDTTATIIWEDDDKRMTQVVVMDLQRNSAFSRTVITNKVVERSKLKKDQVAISQRQNSAGQIAYLVAATNDEVNLAEASGVSKSIRTLGERLLPPHYKQEWRARAERAVHDKAATDPEGEKKRLIDAFAEKGIMPQSIEAWLEHPLAELVPGEIVSLRKIWVAIANGEISWKEVMDTKHGEAEDAEVVNPGAAKVKDILEKKKASETADKSNNKTVFADKSPDASKSATPATSQPAPGAAPPATQTTPPDATPPDAGQTLRDYQDFPEVPFEDGLRITVKGVPYVAVAGAWKKIENGPQPVSDKRRPRGQLDFGEEKK